MLACRSRCELNGFRVVGVDYGNVLEPERPLSRSYEQIEAGFGGDIEAADMAVAGIEAIADRNIDVGEARDGESWQAPSDRRLAARPPQPCFRHIVSFRFILSSAFTPCQASAMPSATFRMPCSTFRPL